MTMNAPRKYDYISENVMVQSGSPTVCKLTPKKEDVGRLKRFIVGEKHPEKTNKTILLVGETETGKSTLINALVNYAMGVTWEDDLWFQMEDEDRRQSQSQKSEVVVYQVFGFEGKTLPYSLTIIDTPGYGDTRGIEHDDIISRQLLDLFRSEDGVHEVNAVGLVLKASENRLSDRLRYIFDATLSLFGKDLEKNIVALVTHSDGRTPVNALNTLDGASVRCARNEKNQPVHFLFDNCQNTERTTEYKTDLKTSWETTMKGISQFTDFVEKTEAQKLKATMDVLTERIRLAKSVRNLHDCMKLVEPQQEEMREAQKALKTYEEGMKNNRHFTIEDDEVYKVVEPFRQERNWWSFLLVLWNWIFFDGATCCTICEENCHSSGCTVAHSPSSCEVMKDGRCTVCTNRCPASAHVKGKWIYVNQTRRVQTTLNDMKRMYESNRSDFQKTAELLKSLEKAKEELQERKDKYLEESFQHVITLEQIALNAHSLSTLVHLDILMEQMKEKGDTEKLEKLEDMRRLVDQNNGIRAALWYVSR